MKRSIYKIALTIVMFSVIAINLQAQERTRVGIKAGVNLSNLYTKEVTDENTLIGFNLGLYAKLPVIRIFAIQPELYYTTKGAKNTYNNVIANGSVKYTFNYLELPVLGVLNITKNFNIQAGPYVGYMLSGKVKNESNVTLFNFENNISTSDYNKIDAGIIAGVGLDFGMANLVLRYSYGVTKVGKSRTYGTSTYTFPDGKNSLLSLNLGISL